MITTTTPMSELLLRLYRYLPLDLRESCGLTGIGCYLDWARFGAWIKGFLKGLRRPGASRRGTPIPKQPGARNSSRARRTSLLAERGDG